MEFFEMGDGKLGKNFQINCGMTSALLHLDWTIESDMVVTNSQAYELKFVDLNAKKGKRINLI